MATLPTPMPPNIGANVDTQRLLKTAQEAQARITKYGAPPPAPAPIVKSAQANPGFGMVGSDQPAGIIASAQAPAPATAEQTQQARDTATSLLPKPDMQANTTSGTPAPAAAPTTQPGLDVAFRDTVNANLRDPAKVGEIIRGSGAKSVAELAAKMGYPAGAVGEGYVKAWLETNGISPDALNQMMGNRTGIITAASQAPSGAAQMGDPTKWNVDPTQTVEGRIQSIINPNSALNVQAATQAQESANARGLGNSSLAISAGQDAVMRNAMPIAQADAATFAKAASWNADQSNQFTRENVAADNAFRQQGVANSQQKDMAAYDRETQQQAAYINRQTQEIITKLDAGNKAAADKVAFDNQKLLTTNGQAATAFNQGMQSVANIQANDKMDGPTKTKAIAQVWADVQTQLRVLGTVAGLDLTASLNFANMPGFDKDGHYVGFNADGSTALPPDQAANAPADALAPKPGIIAGGGRYPTEDNPYGR